MPIGRIGSGNGVAKQVNKFRVGIILKNSAGNVLVDISFRALFKREQICWSSGIIRRGIYQNSLFGMVKTGFIPLSALFIVFAKKKWFFG